METDDAVPPACREWRRLRALHLKQQGWKQRDIAAALGVSEAAVSHWLAAARGGDAAALHARRRSGAPSRLTPAQRSLIPELLWHGAEAYGFRGEVWTCARVAAVIAQEYGVSYSKSHASRLLRQLGWTPQLPISRARQRDEAAIDRWRVEAWPQLWAQAKRERRPLVFVDEAGFYLLPGMVKTYAPAGQTPVIRARQMRDHLAVMGGLTPEGRLYVLVRQHALTGVHTIAFLEHLLRCAGPRLLVIWDGSPIHRRGEVHHFLASGRGQGIVVAALPGYAPDLNPWDAGGWQHLKHVEMGNLACADLEELHLELHAAISRLRQKPHLIHGFFTAATLA
ncbi:MAG TPA: IS630 family transposase, partial [Chloroflexota bacterium]|nr:IS630 family transposase [Chloroflexota bacterium]